jgi:hypothetical protein
LNKLTLFIIWWPASPYERVNVTPGIKKLRNPGLSLPFLIKSEKKVVNSKKRS